MYENYDTNNSSTPSTLGDAPEDVSQGSGREKGP